MNAPGIETVLTQNVAALMMAASFLWYLSKRDKQVADTFDKLGERMDKFSQRLEELSDIIARVNDEMKTKKRR